MLDEVGRLSALIGSRICHDLISPIGAIGNGLELLSMAGVAPGPEVGLLADSVAAANARVRFFRIAFGNAEGAPPVAGAELRDILEGVHADGRIRVRWRVDGDVARREARLAFLSILCLECALPFGGEIRVHRDADGWHLFTVAERLRVDPALWGILRGEAAPTPPTAAEVQFPLLRLAILEGERVTVRDDPERVEIRISPRAGAADG
ncbi:MAG: histidine phosphotransferase [Alphaproteobacteria bacterium]|nr:MAG: histidine phosphotransferase [Alphaproteobacteria bacterium]